MFTNGHKINVGRIYSKSRNVKVSIAKLGNKNPAWKGDGVGYKALHAWMRKHKIRAKNCQHCGNNERRLEIANLNGVYNRDINNYLWLCRSCHRKHDGVKPVFSWLGRKLPEKTIKKLKSINRPRNKSGEFIEWK
jgi:hypothetical protein